MQTESLPPGSPVAGLCSHCGIPAPPDRKRRFCSTSCRRKAQRSGEAVRLSRLEQLALAGRLAPRLRDRSTTRKVTTVDAKGNPVRTVTVRELGLSVAGAVGIQFDVAPEEPPEVATCEACQTPFKLAKRTKHKRRTVCDACRYPLCSTGCGRRLPSKSMQPYFVKLRAGQPPICGVCNRKRMGEASRSQGWLSATCACGSKKSKTAKKCAACAGCAPKPRASCKCGASIAATAKSGMCRSCFAASPAFYMAGLEARHAKRKAGT